MYPQILLGVLLHQLTTGVQENINEEFKEVINAFPILPISNNIEEPTNPRIYVIHHRFQPNLNAIIEGTLLFRWSPPIYKKELTGYRIKWSQSHPTVGPDHVVNVSFDTFQFNLKCPKLNTSFFFSVNAKFGNRLGQPTTPQKVSCNKADPPVHLILSSGNKLIEYDFDLMKEVRIIGTGKNISEPVFLAVQNCFFWFDLHWKHLVYSNGSSMVIANICTDAKSLSLDWIGQVLYWSCNNEIHKFDIARLHVDNFVRKLPFETSQTFLYRIEWHIKNLKIDSFNSCLYASIQTQSGLDIARINVDGHSRSINRNLLSNCSLAHKSHFGSPFALSLSSGHIDLYMWINDIGIVMVDLRAGNCSVVYESKLKLSNGGYITSAPKNILISFRGIFLEPLVKTNEILFKLHTSNKFTKYKISFKHQSMKLLDKALQPLPLPQCLTVPKLNRTNKIKIVKTSSRWAVISTHIPLNHCPSKKLKIPSIVKKVVIKSLNDSSKFFRMIIDTDLYNVSKLRPYTHYNVKFFPFNYFTDFSRANGSPNAGFTTKPDVPGIVDSLSVFSYTDTKLLVRWNMPSQVNGPVNKIGFKLQWIEDVDDIVNSWMLPETIICTPKNDTKRCFKFAMKDSEKAYFYVIIEKLKIETKYRVKIQAYSTLFPNHFGEEYIAENATFYALNLLKQDKVSANYAAVAWVNSRPNIVASVLGKVINTGELLKFAPKNGISNFHRFLNLKPFTKYILNYAVTIKRIDDEIPANMQYPRRHATIRFKTLPGPPNAPEAPIVLKASNYNKVNVTWKTPKVNSLENVSFKLVARKKNSSYNWTEIYNGTSRWTAFHSSEFEFRVKAYTIYGHSNYSLPNKGFHIVSFLELPRSKHLETGFVGYFHVYLICGTLAVLFLFIILSTCFFGFVQLRKMKRLKGCRTKEGAIPMAALPFYISTSSLDLNNGVDSSHEANILYGGDKHYLSQINIIPSKNINSIKIIGSGAFGDVYSGYLTSATEPTRDVALKTLRGVGAGKELRQFLKEAALMSGFKHPYIVEIFGVSVEKDIVSIVMELMSGDLLSWLRDYRDSFEETKLTNLLSMALDISKGCQYLETMRFVHRDIAARNCLLSHDNRVKLGDFGMARDLYSGEYYRKNGECLLPVRWMAPEALADGLFTIKSDVWSFGILLWEIITLGRQPYIGRSNLEVMYYVSAGGRLEPPDKCVSAIGNLMKRCWHTVTDCRPTFHSIRETLEDLLTTDLVDDSVIYVNADDIVVNEELKAVSSTWYSSLNHHTPHQCRSGISSVMSSRAGSSSLLSAANSYNALDELHFTSNFFLTQSSNDSDNGNHSDEKGIDSGFASSFFGQISSNEFCFSNNPSETLRNSRSTPITLRRLTMPIERKYYRSIYFKQTCV